MSIDRFSLFLGGIFFVSVGYLCVALYFLLKYKRSGDARFDAFYVEGKELIVNSLFKPRYLLEDIASIELSCSRIRRGTRYLGSMRVIQKNGKKSRYHYFESKVYYRKFSFKSRKEDILLAMKRVEEDLKTVKIPYTIIEKERNIYFY